MLLYQYFNVLNNLLISKYFLFLCLIVIIQLANIFIITAFFYLSFLFYFLKNSINFLNTQFTVTVVKLICLISDFSLSIIVELLEDLFLPFKIIYYYNFIYIRLVKILHAFI